MTDLEQDFQNTIKKILGGKPAKYSNLVKKSCVKFRPKKKTIIEEIKKLEKKGVLKTKGRKKGKIIKFIE